MSRARQQPLVSTAAYRAREQQALLDLAIATYADKTAPEGDRVAARARLTADTSPPNMRLLSFDEVRTLVEAMRTTDRLLAIARGGKREPVDPQLAAPSEAPSTSGEGMEARPEVTPEPASLPRYTLAQLGIR